MSDTLLVIGLFCSIIFLIAVYSKISSITKADRKNDGQLLLLENEIRKKDSIITTLQDKIKDQHLYVQGLQSAHKSEIERLEKKISDEAQAASAAVLQAGRWQVDAKDTKSVVVPDALDTEQQNIFDLIEYGQGNVFVQGQAGTGKSSFVAYLKKHTTKKILLTAFTGVAAMNIEGVTLHSLFQWPLENFFFIEKMKPSLNTALILQKADVLIIDEISMVRADMLDVIDKYAQLARGNDCAFGGLQLLLIGDLYQLPPVIKDEVKNHFEKTYGNKNAYFFDALAYKHGNFSKRTFTRVYRQGDSELLQQLKNLREQTHIDEALAYFNNTKFEDPTICDTAICICPHLATAEQINCQMLARINAQERVYTCKIKGHFTEKEMPAAVKLVLKVGALVMCIRNISVHCINGSIGMVTELGDDLIGVRLQSTGKIVLLGRNKWQKFEYVYDEKSGQIEEREKASFEQFPLQLGYAMTIHKAQGKTLDKVNIDMHKGAFAHGQLYVALSRTRARADMHITGHIKKISVIFDKRIVEFSNEATAI